MNLATIRELFAYNDWGRDRLMRLVVKLDDGQLDRPFEMGEGSLRKTMWHLFKWEWMWLRRWQGASPVAEDCPRDFPSMQDLWNEWRETASRRDDFLAGLSDEDLRRRVTSTGTEGKPYTFLRGHMMLHVCNHGTHHRAQAVNMLRHVGVKPPPMDFLEMVHEQQTHRPR